MFPGSGPPGPPPPPVQYIPCTRLGGSLADSKGEGNQSGWFPKGLHRLERSFLWPFWVQKFLVGVRRFGLARVVLGKGLAQGIY
jgi:hypothetical protein